MKEKEVIKNWEKVKRKMEPTKRVVVLFKDWLLLPAHSTCMLQMLTCKHSNADTNVRTCEHHEGA